MNAIDVITVVLLAYLCCSQWRQARAVHRWVSKQQKELDRLRKCIDRLEGFNKSSATVGRLTEDEMASFL